MARTVAQLTITGLILQAELPPERRKNQAVRDDLRSIVAMSAALLINCA